MLRAYSKQHLKYLHRILPKVKCNICGITKEQLEGNNKKLVWDHNHDNNMIRGVLCEICNSWLVLYEKQLICNFSEPSKVYGEKVALWMKTYKIQIGKHLNTITS